MLSFAATVRVVPSEPGHGLLLVVLDADDGTRWLASYHADALWKEFADRRVVIHGERHTPEGQALAMPHVRVDRWSIPEPTMTDRVVDVGPELALEGAFEDYVWPDRTKLAGTRSIRFRLDGGESYPLARGDAAERGKHVALRGRLVALSPFAAHESGPFLWITSDARGETR